MTSEVEIDSAIEDDSEETDSGPKSGELGDFENIVGERPGGPNSLIEKIGESQEFRELTPPLLGMAGTPVLGAASAYAIAPIETLAGFGFVSCSSIAPLYAGLKIFEKRRKEREDNSVSGAFREVTDVEDARQFLSNSDEYSITDNSVPGYLPSQDPVLSNELDDVPEKGIDEIYREAVNTLENEKELTARNIIYLHPEADFHDADGRFRDPSEVPVEKVKSLLEIHEQTEENELDSELQEKLEETKMSQLLRYSEVDDDTYRYALEIYQGESLKFRVFGYTEDNPSEIGEEVSADPLTLH